MRASPPRLKFEGAAMQKEQKGDEGAGRPALTIQPASPAMSSAAIFASPTSPFPPPIPSTSATPSAATFERAPSALPPGGGLAARRAAKLGKKRLSLVVPTGSSSGAGGALLSPASPSYLRPGGNDDAETRSLPPSPVSLTTFIGTEGSEAPDRTIGRLMLKQQADEMREQMRGGRGMKRRTSIPRLNLVGGGGAAKPAHLDNLASAGGGGGPSMVQLIRGDAIERRGGGAGQDEEGEVEEFPYALGPREILPGVFLGSEQNAKDAAVLRDWRIGFVLNVAKEVECPWGAEEAIEEEETTDEEPSSGSGCSSQDVTPPALPSTEAFPPPPLPPLSHTPAPPPVPQRPKHRRTKTQAAVSTLSRGAAADSGSLPPVRPPFIRPTASTPNLHAVFSPPSPAPPVPAIPGMYLPSTTPDDSLAAGAAAAETMQRSLSSSPPVPRRTPPRPLAARRPPPTQANATSTRSAGAVRIPASGRSGRPSLEYLWLKWGHDEADLVEAKKFQAAFDFLDEARERGERVLVHCQCGVSRSATVVIAYCMREAAKALEDGRDAEELAGCTGMHDTYSFVKDKSEWVGPNLSLVFQLVAYERTLRGDALGGEEGDEPAYPDYPPEEAILPTAPTPLPLSMPNGTSHPARQEGDDLPPPPPSTTFGSFSFPARDPPPPSFATSHLPPLRSPRTPVSLEGSISVSQLSTPDLVQHDPLTSPSNSSAFSSATKASSVTSTPLSVGVGGEYEGLPQPVRVVRADEDSALGLRDRHSSLDTVVADESPGSYGRAGERGEGKPFFVLPVPPAARQPPNGVHGLHLPLAEEAASPTIAFHPRSSLRPAAPALSLSVPASPLVTSAPISGCTSTAAAAIASPFPLAPSSPSSALSPQISSPHSSVPSSTSSTSIASIASAVSATSAASGASGLSRSGSTRRFGAGQTLSQRRASHRRVFSDTIRVESALLLTSPSSAAGREREADGR
ncbi:tyrosine/serine/threonine protein phosphatase [Rhodosporidiobolus nylandii]